MNKPASRPPTIVIALLVTSTLLLVPLAAAASFPVLGTWEWMSIGGAFVIVAIIFAASLLVPQVRGFTKKIPVLGRMGPIAAALLLLVGAVVVNDGSLAHGGGFGASASVGTVAPNAAAAASGAFAPRSELTFYAADKATPSTTLNAVVKVYTAGVADKAAYEGSAQPLYSVTLSSGKGTISGIDTTQGCKVDVTLDLSLYYQMPAHGQNICDVKNGLGTNPTVPLPTFYLEHIGHASLNSTDDTLTCAAAAQCTFRVTIDNSIDKTYLHHLALKFGSATNATLDSVSGSNCDLVEVSGTQYMPVLANGGNLGPLESVTCLLQITRSSGSADGEFTLTVDDNWNDLAASTWNTNANVRGTNGAVTETVSFA